MVTLSLPPILSMILHHLIQWWVGPCRVPDQGVSWAAHLAWARHQWWDTWTWGVWMEWIWHLWAIWQTWITWVPWRVLWVAWVRVDPWVQWVLPAQYLVPTREALVLSQCPFLLAKYTLQINLWYSILKILTHPPSILAEFVIKKFTIMTKQYCANLDATSGFTGSKFISTKLFAQLNDCLNSFHRICTGLTEAAYHLLTAEVYAEWVCDKCLQSKNIPLVKFKPWVAPYHPFPHCFLFLCHFLSIPSNHFVIKIYELYYYVKETPFIKHDKSPHLYDLMKKYHHNKQKYFSIISCEVSAISALLSYRRRCQESSLNKQTLFSKIWLILFKTEVISKTN